MSFDPFALPRRVTPPGDATAGQFIQAGFGSAPIQIQKDFDFERAIVKGFDVNPIAFACMDRTAIMASGIPWRYEEKIAGKWQPVPDADEIQILLRPNASMGLMQMHWFATEALMGGGNFLLKKVKIGKRVDELWPMNLARAEPLVQADQWIVGYWVWESSRRILAPAEDVIHTMRGMNTLKPFWGRSPMMTAMATVEMSNKQILWNSNLVDESAVPRGAFVAPETPNRQPLNQKQINEAKEKIRQEYSGPSNAGVPMLLGGGIKWEAMGMTPVEIDWIKSQSFAVTLVCASLGHMPVMFSGENMTFNNLSTATTYGWTHSATPILKMLRDAYNNDTDLIPLDKVGKRRYTYDLSEEDATLAGLAKRIESHDKAVRAGVNVADSLEMHHLPLPIRPEYDVTYAPKGLSVVGGTPEDPEPPAAPTEGEEE